jgi:uncharacterized protein (DUF2236 family)
VTSAPNTSVVESELPARPLGPGAVAWYANSDNRFLLVSVRTLILQVAHPMVGAGVADHSVSKTDPWGTSVAYGGVPHPPGARRV